MPPHPQPRTVKRGDSYEVECSACGLVAAGGSSRRQAERNAKEHRSEFS